MGFFNKIKVFSLRELNRKVAVRATLMFGTMAAVYLFFIWSILPIIFPDIQPVVLYISSCVIQLVALPLIMVGTNVLSEKAEARAQQDHEMIMEQFEIAKHMREEADKQREEADKQRTKILEVLTELEEMQVAANEQRLKLLEINDNELKELVELKGLHEDLHQLLNNSKSKRKVKK